MSAPHAWHAVNPAITQMLRQVREDGAAGEVADYIPELAHADPNLFSISTASVSGRTYEAGDTSATFTIQSISKAFTYALILKDHGVEKTCQYVGIEPSGEPFNAISFDSLGRPANPMINAGAVVTTSLISAANAQERFERIQAGLGAFAGRTLEVDEKVRASESATADRNRALAMLAKEHNVLNSSVEDAVEPYIAQCSLLVDSSDLAIMGATLANDGTNPVTSEQVVSADVARHTLSVMASCGMYERSGQWLFDVGMPAKSGVAGGIVAVAPGEFGIGVFSPPLDPAGNSALGVTALTRLSDEFGLHLFKHPPRPVSPVETIQRNPDGASVTIELRGTLDFVAAEQTVYEVITWLQENAVQEAQKPVIIVDVSSVTAVTEVAAQLLEALANRASESGWRTVMEDPHNLIPR